MAKVIRQPCLYISYGGGWCRLDDYGKRIYSGKVDSLTFSVF